MLETILLDKSHKIASRGDDRGPAYDVGVLHVTNQILLTGTFNPSYLYPILIERDNATTQNDSPVDREKAEIELRSRNVKIVDWYEYSRRVLDAELKLSSYLAGDKAVLEKSQ